MNFTFNSRNKIPLQVVTLFRSAVTSAEIDKLSVLPRTFRRRWFGASLSRLTHDFLDVEKNSVPHANATQRLFYIHVRVKESS